MEHEVEVSHEQERAAQQEEIVLHKFQPKIGLQQTTTLLFS